jgi:hypothetical protein
MLNGNKPCDAACAAYLWDFLQHRNPSKHLLAYLFLKKEKDHTTL